MDRSAKDRKLGLLSPKQGDTGIKAVRVLAVRLFHETSFFRSVHRPVTTELHFGSLWITFCSNISNGTHFKNV